MLDLIDGAIGPGWEHRRACTYLELGEARARGAGVSAAKRVPGGPGVGWPGSGKMMLLATMVDEIDREWLQEREEGATVLVPARQLGADDLLVDGVDAGRPGRCDRPSPGPESWRWMAWTRRQSRTVGA